MESNPLLESYLRQLHLPAFIKHYQSFAKDATQNNLDYPRYLLALVENEIQTREQNRIQHSVKSAHFPIQKELADFDFSALPSLNKARILDILPNPNHSFLLEIRAWEKHTSAFR
jgi:DNA replication protein DnaC